MSEWLWGCMILSLHVTIGGLCWITIGCSILFVLGLIFRQKLKTQWDWSKLNKKPQERKEI
jgi:hypothetical protein